MTFLLGRTRAPCAHAAVTPNWFASVMGTGIVAVAGATLPFTSPLLDGAAVVVWVVATGWLAVLSVLAVRRRGSLLGDPVMAHFYGAVPMALLTVGAGAVVVGYHLIGSAAAVGLDTVLWTLGTIGGVATAVAVPYRQFTAHEVRDDAAAGSWLMPIVPPMVSASTGALLIPHTPAGQARLTLFCLCLALFGMSLLSSIVVITQVWQRLAHHKLGPAAAIPTLWIVLGPLGQSVTAACLLGRVAGEVLPAPYSTAFRAFGLVYGIPVWGFAAMWAALAVSITTRAARARLPFSLTWWSFTFPVGTCVTAASGLARASGADLFRAIAVLTFACLVVAWLVVAVRTAHGLRSGAVSLTPR